MDVLSVLVVVAERIVVVTMGVGAGRHGVVAMPVVSVVVHVRVVVVDRQVRVRMRVTLRRVKPHADGHQARADSATTAPGQGVPTIIATATPTKGAAAKTDAVRAAPTIRCARR